LVEILGDATLLYEIAPVEGDHDGEMQEPLLPVLGGKDDDGSVVNPVRLLLSKHASISHRITAD